MNRLITIAFAILLAIPTAFAQFGSGGPVSISNTATNTNRTLCSIRGANFNITTDQACTIPAGVTAWAPTSIVVTNCTGTFTLAAGGVYPATSKGGTALVSAAQAYTALTGLGLTLVAGIATTRQTINTVYLSLTTGTGSAATCDFYLWGNDLT